MKTMLRKVMAVMLLAAGAFCSHATPVEIGTAEAFATALSADPTGSYVITADLDFTTLDPAWAPLEFSGTLDGGGHAITGLTKCGLFSRVTGTVENLTISGCVCAKTDWPNVAGPFGVLTYECVGGTIRNVTVKDANITTTRNIRYKIGGIVGVMSGKGGLIESCKVVNCVIDKSNSYVGGIIGYSGSDVEFAVRSCSVINVRLNGQWAGGIMGQPENASKTTTSVISLEDCFVSGSVSAATYAGGFVGYLGNVNDETSKTSFVRCRNEAAVTGTGSATGVGGIFGYAYRGKGYVLNGCSNYGTIYTKGSASNAGAGGLIGGLFSGTSGAACVPCIVNCVNYGSVGTGSQMAGGIIGNCPIQSAGTFTNVANHGSVSAGTTYAGGIIGRFVSGKWIIPFCSAQNTGAISASASDTTAIAGGIVGYDEIGVLNMQPFCGQMSIGEVTTAGYAGLLWGSLKNTKMKSFNVSHAVLDGTASGAQSGQFIASAAGSTVEIVFNPAEGKVLSSATAEHTYYNMANAGVDLDLPALGDGLTDGTARTLMNEYAATDANFSTWKQGKEYPYMAFEDEIDPVGCPMVQLTFRDTDGSVIANNTVLMGTSVIPYPPDPVKAGYSFLGWEGNTVNLQEDTVLTAKWKQGEIQFYTVTFQDWDETVLQQTLVKENTAAEAPDDPVRADYVFTGWDKPFDNITSDTLVTAQYDVQYYEVSDAAGLKALLNAKRLPGYFISVTEDLDFTGEGCAADSLVCQLDGQGHTFSGLTTNLFGQVSGQVRNVVLDGGSDGTVIAFSNQMSDFGLVASAVTGGNIENVIVRNFTVTRASGGAGSRCYGLIAGTISPKSGRTAVVSNCVVESSCSVGHGSANGRAGGIVGLVNASMLENDKLAASIVNCTNAAPVYAVSGVECGLGGIVGGVEGFSLSSKPRVVIDRCVNLGPIQDDSRLWVTNASACVGGIVGKVLGGTDSGAKGALTIRGCASLAAVGSHSAMANCGGIIGGTYRHPELTLTNCVNRGAVGNAEAGSCGGLFGSLPDTVPGGNLYVSDSANYGDVFGSYVAAFVAVYAQNDNAAGMRFEAMNCANYGALNGAETNAAFVAWFKTDFSATKTSGSFTLLATNCFLSAEAPVVGRVATPSTNTQFRVLTDGLYTPSDTRAVKSLNTWADANGYGSWVMGRVNGVTSPELATFCSRPYVPGFMLIIR